jgi:hypothetical protein
VSGYLRKADMENLIYLYNTWNKPEKAKEWQSKLPKTEAKTE